MFKIYNGYCLYLNQYSSFILPHIHFAIIIFNLPNAIIIFNLPKYWLKLPAYLRKVKYYRIPIKNVYLCSSQLFHTVYSISLQENQPQSILQPVTRFKKVNKWNKNYDIWRHWNHIAQMHRESSAQIVNATWLEIVEQRLHHVVLTCPLHG